MLLDARGASKVTGFPSESYFAFAILCDFASLREIALM